MKKIFLGLIMLMSCFVSAQTAKEIIDNNIESVSYTHLDVYKRQMDDIPKSNVLIYYTEDGTKVCIRPSGTEPKIKFYVSVKDSISSEEDFIHKLPLLQEKINQIKTCLLYTSRCV